MAGSPLRSELPRMVSNLVTLYTEQSLRSDRMMGLEWYPTAHQIVCEWSSAYERSIANVACVIASISPQCDWPRNLIIADETLQGHNVPSIGGALPANLRKAQRVRDERLSSLLDVFPGGPKVNSFSTNLAGDYSVVTVDAHALQAALNDVTSTRTLKWAAYAVVSSAYVQAAQRLGIQPAHLQAIVWVTWKRLNPAASKRNAKRLARKGF